MRVPGIAVLAAIVAFFGFALYSVESFTSLFMHQAFGTSFTIIGLIFTGANLSGSVLQIYTGRTGDRIGHKPMLAISYSFAAASLAGLYITAQFEHSLIIFSLLFVVFAGSLWSSFPSFGSLVSITSRDKVTGFTITRVAVNVGTAIGPGVAGFTISAFGFPVIYLSAFLAVMVSLMLTLFLVHPEHASPSGDNVPSSSAFSFRSVNRTILLVSVSSLLITILLAQDTVTLPNYASIIRNLTTSQIGLVFTSNGILVVLMQYPVSRAIQKIGIAAGFLMGLLFFSIGVLSFMFDSTLAQFIMSEAIMTFGEDFLDPSGSAIISTLSERRRIGENMGVFNSFNSIGYSMGPLLGGIVMGVTLNPYAIWIIVTMPGFVSVILYIMFTLKKVVSSTTKTPAATVK